MSNLKNLPCIVKKQCFTVPHIFWWNVEELQIKEYESGDSGNSRWIPGGFQA
jgi:hypothetical protein